MSGRWLPVWVVPLTVALAVGTVWLRLAIIRTSYSISETEREIAHRLQERERIGLKVAELRSPRRLELLARTRFGLTQPSADQVVHIK